MTQLVSQFAVLRGAVDSVAAHLPALVDVVVRSSLVLLLALVVTRLMRRTSAAARHTVWVCAVLVAMMIPLIARVAPRWETHVLPASWGSVTLAPAPTARRSAAVDAPAVAPTSSVMHAGSAPTAPRVATPISTPDIAPVAPISSTVSTSTPTSTPTSTTPANTSWSIAQWIALVWVAGAALVLLRLAVGTGVVWSTARHARRVDDAEWLLLVQRKARELGIARPVILLASPRQMVPVTWGVIYPIVLLPESALTWEPARREAVLVHELAHVGRLDALTHTIVQIAVALFWFDPFVWIAARHVRSERERACDDLVLAHGARASAYADDLLSMVRSLTRNTEPAFAALAMARRSEFEGRMLAILDPRASRRRIGVRGVAMAFACSLAIAFPLAALRPLPRMASVVDPTVSAHQSGVSSAAASASSSASSASALEQAGDALHAAGRVLDSTAQTVARAAGSSSSTCTLGNGHHVSIHSDDSESNFVLSDNSRCIVMTSTGKVTFTDDDAGIASISSGGHVSITEVTASGTRRYEAHPTSGGLAETFYSGDAQTSADGANRTWLRGVIHQIVRQDASLAPARVTRIRARSGVPGVLAEIDSIQGDYAKTAYYTALLDQGGISDDSVRLITERGIRELTSDYYKSEFLTAAAKHSRNVAPALASAARGMGSDYYKRQVLTSALSGDGDRAVVAREVVAAASTMNSDYDRAQVLQQLLGRAKLGDALTIAVIQSAGGINNDYYRAVVLDSVIATQPIGAKPVYTALLQATKGISSGYYRSQVLMNVLHAKNVPADAVAAVLSSTSDFESANDKANVLVEAAGTPSIHNPTVREAYFAAAKSLGDGTEARRALTAVMP